MLVERHALRNGVRDDANSFNGLRPVDSRLGVDRFGENRRLENSEEAFAVTEGRQVVPESPRVRVR